MLGNAIVMIIAATAIVTKSSTMVNPLFLLCLFVLLEVQGAREEEASIVEK